MNPVNDIVCNLLETPFWEWKEEDKRDVLLHGRPTFMLQIFTPRPGKCNKPYNIYFNSSWFDRHKWLCTSPSLQKVYCWPCLLFTKKHTTLSKEGVDNLLNLNRLLQSHPYATEHMKCEILLKNFEKNQSILADALEEQSKLLKEVFNEDVRLNRLFLKKAIKAVLYLIKQEFVLSNKSKNSNIENENFIELLTQLIAGCPLEIQNHYEKNKNIFTNYSETIKNVLIDCISDSINDYVNNEIKDARCFSIQVNDGINTNQTSHCFLTVRFLSSDGKLVERFLGFHNVNEYTSIALFQMLDRTLEQFDYQHKLVAQSYDRACVKPEHLNELQEKIKEKVTHTIFVHCLENPLSIILRQSVSDISECRNFFACLSEMSLFFCHSGKRSYAITSITTKGITATNISQWSTVSSLVSIIIDDWDKLKQVFKVLINSKRSDKETIQLVKGFLNYMNTFEFTFLAVVFNEIFACIRVLFETLQKNSLNIEHHLSKLKKTREHLSQKGIVTFIKLFEKANKMAKNLPKHEYATPPNKTIFQEMFLKIVDHILLEIDTRFLNYDKLHFASLLDTTQFKHFDTIKHFPCSYLDKLQHLYVKLFSNPHKLKAELSVLYSKKELWNISLQELLYMLHKDKDIFPESYTLASIIAIIPTVSLERNSCLKRVRTYLKNTKFQEKIASLANISIQKEVLLTIMEREKFYDNIIDRFAMKEKRLELVFKT